MRCLSTVSTSCSSSTALTTCKLFSRAAGAEVESEVALAGSTGVGAAALRDLLTGHQPTQGLELLLQPTNLTPAWSTLGLFGAFLEPGEPLGAIANVI